MKTLQFETHIHGHAQKVWDILWGQDTYNQWTKYFSPDSQVQSDWKVGGKTLFLDGRGNGMISTIQSKKEPFEMVFKHLGTIENGVEDTTSEKIKAWAGALEKYYLSEKSGSITLTVMVDIEEQFVQMLNDGFTKGLQTVKELAEDNFVI